MNLHTKIRHAAIKDLSQDTDDDINTLNNTLRLLSKWRSLLIQNTYIKMEGVTVFSGPLAGLNFVKESSEGCHMAKLLGTYEQPLHKHIENLSGTRYEKIINIGCAEGYYAIGLTRMFPNSVSLAYDTDPEARKKCKILASLNGVQDRVEVHKEFHSNDFARFANTRALVFCDIEGHEKSLFHENIVPFLSGVDIIIECHECVDPQITDTLIARFSNTHVISEVRDNGSRTLVNMPTWFVNMSHLDQLLAIWEWRTGPTPWLVMRSKKYN